MAQWVSVEEQKRRSDEIEKAMNEASRKATKEKAARGELSRQQVSNVLKGGQYSTRDRAEIITKQSQATGKPVEVSQEEYDKFHKELKTQQAQEVMKETTVPEGKIVVEPNQAYEAGLISKRDKEHAEKTGSKIVTTGEDVQRAKQYTSALRKEYPEATVSPGQAAADKYYRMKQQEQEVTQKVADAPLTRVSYVFDRDTVGFGTVSEFAVTALTGGDWEKKSGEMRYSYATELMGRDNAVYSGGVAAVKTGVVAGAMAASGGVAGKTAAVVSGTGMRVAYGTSLGIQYGYTIKNPTAENFARSFVYSVPLAVGAAAKAVRYATKPKYTLEVAKTASKDTYQQKGKVQVTKSDSVTKYNVVEKGLRARLGLGKPKVVGEVYGVGKSVQVSTDTAGVGTGRFAYAGKVKGQRVVITGKDAQISSFQATDSAVRGTSATLSKSDYVVGKKGGFGRSASKTQYTAQKVADTPKQDVWYTADKTAGIRENNLVMRKANALQKNPEIKTNTEAFLNYGNGVSVIGKGGSSGISEPGFTKPVTVAKTGTTPQPKMQLGVETLQKVTSFAAEPSIPKTQAPAVPGTSKSKTSTKTNLQPLSAAGFTDVDTGTNVKQKQDLDIFSALAVLQTEKIKHGQAFVVDTKTRPGVGMRNDFMVDTAVDVAVRQDQLQMTPQLSLQAQALTQIQGILTPSQPRMGTGGLAAPKPPTPSVPLIPNLPWDTGMGRRRGRNSLNVFSYQRVWGIATSAKELSQYFR